MCGVTSYRYWTLNPDQATSDVTKSPPDPVISAKSITRKTTITGMKEASIHTELVAEAHAGQRGVPADDSIV